MSGVGQQAVDPGSGGIAPLGLRAVVTSSAGLLQQPLHLADRRAGSTGASVTVHPDRPRQTIYGIGSSLTQASAAVLQRLPAATRRRVLQAAFGPDGACFSMVRTHIGSCDFSTHSYCHAPEPDAALAGFSLDADRDIGLLALLRDAATVPGADFRLIASPWTAPPWMKDNGRYFEPDAKRGGRLLAEHYGTFARYTARYIRAMAAEGLPIWALTPVNEPHGNQGTWESMEMSPAEQARYVAVLGEALSAAGLDPHILIYDQNRRGMIEFADTVFSDPRAAEHAWGTAVHWYDSTFRVYEDLLDALHEAWPDRPIVQTEGCIDNVFGKGADRGPGAPTPWWQDDGWFWRKEATDWGWDWAPEPERDHPPYAPAFRYARDMVGGLGHWLAGWVDWNLVLDRRGGPNHVGNFCLAPILVDGEQVYFTPLFHLLSQVSRHTRPGAVVLETTADCPAGVWVTALRGPDGAGVVHVFNERDEPVEVRVLGFAQAWRIPAPPQALVTATMGQPRSAHSRGGSA